MEKTLLRAAVRGSNADFKEQEVTVKGWSHITAAAANAFLQVRDGTGSIRVSSVKNEVSPETFKRLRTYDAGNLGRDKSALSKKIKEARSVLNFW